MKRKLRCDFNLCFVTNIRVQYTEVFKFLKLPFQVLFSECLILVYKNEQRQRRYVTEGLQPLMAVERRLLDTVFR